jgi:hypothetical protein
MLKEVMKDLWLARISSLSNEVGLYAGEAGILLHIYMKTGMRGRRVHPSF